MSDEQKTPLQRRVAEAIQRAEKARDYYDGLLRQMLNTSGKPLWDIERGKTKKPEPRTLRAIEEVLGMAAESLVDLVHPRGRDGPTRTSDQQPTRSADAGEVVDIMELDLSVSMGPGTLIEDFVESEAVSFDVAKLRRITKTPSDRLRFITGIGTSHEPKFQSGDQFLIDINDRELARIDGYYWITFEDAHALKRLRPIGSGMVRIISENPDFEPMDVPKKSVRIEGRAIWFARGL